MKCKCCGEEFTFSFFDICPFCGTDNSVSLFDKIIDDNGKKNDQNIIDSNLLDNLKYSINNNENKRNNLINNITPIEETNKDIEKNNIKIRNDKNPTKQNNDKNKKIGSYLNNNSNKNKININNNFNSDKKGENKILIDNFKINPGVLRTPKFEKKENENLDVFDPNKKKEDLSKDKNFLNKKLERENILTKASSIEKIGNKDDKNNIFISKKNLTSENKIPKNKNKNKYKNGKINDKKNNQNQISLEEEVANYPSLKQKKEEMIKFDEELTLKWLRNGNVKVEKVNIMNTHPKDRRVGRYTGKTNRYKKAIVKLAEGSTISFD